jgi:hypothetical protein
MFEFDPDKSRANKLKEFDAQFDAGEDASAHYDLEQAVRPGLEQRRVSVDFPVWMVQ